MVIEISNGIENTQFVQLKKSVSRDIYGNLLEDFVTTLIFFQFDGYIFCLFLGGLPL